MFEDFHDNNEGLQNDAGFGDFGHQGESGPGFDSLGAGDPNDGGYGHGAQDNYDVNGHEGPSSYGHSPYGDNSHDSPSPYNDGGQGNYDNIGPSDHGHYGDSDRTGHAGYDPLVHQGKHLIFALFLMLFKNYRI